MYSPNTYGILGMRLTYRGFSISLSTRAGDLKDRHKYGKTKYTSLFAGLHLKVISFEAYYRNYKGYADLHTTTYSDSAPDSLSYLIRNDLRNRHFKLKAIYQFSKKKFSYPAIFNFTERQMKSATALFFMGTVNRLHMDADSSFFPYHQRVFYKDLRSITDLKVSSIGGAVGGAFTVVYKQLFISGILFLGVDYQYQKYFLPSFDSWDHRFTAAVVTDSRFSFGVNGNRAFAALTVKNDVNNLNLATFRSKNTYTMVTFDFGYRFNAPRFVEKTYTKAHQFIHSIF
jgi:hypothetical protein